MNSVTIFERCIQPTLVKPEHAHTRETIGLCARVSQAIFGIAGAFAVLKATIQLGLVLTGGSIFFHAIPLAIHIFDAIICYDLIQVATNITHMYKQRSLIQIPQGYLDNVPSFVISLFEANDLATVKKSFDSHLGKVPLFTNKLTNETIAVQYLNPYINQLLSLPASR